MHSEKSKFSQTKETKVPRTLIGDDFVGVFTPDQFFFISSLSLNHGTSEKGNFVCIFHIDGHSSGGQAARRPGGRAVPASNGAGNRR